MKVIVKNNRIVRHKGQVLELMAGQPNQEIPEDFLDSPFLQAYIVAGDIVPEGQATSDKAADSETASAEAEKILADAKEKAAAIIKDAEDQAAKIVAAGEEQLNAIISDAEEKAKSIGNDAKNKTKNTKVQE